VSRSALLAVVSVAVLAGCEVLPSQIKLTGEIDVPAIDCPNPPPVISLTPADSGLFNLVCPWYGIEEDSVLVGSGAEAEWIATVDTVYHEGIGTTLGG
jgi:hypothetical protein